MTFENSLAFAQHLDAQDQLSQYQNEFSFPQVNGKKVIYFTGNSLGLQPKRAKTLLLKVIFMLKNLGGITTNVLQIR